MTTIYFIRHGEYANPGQIAPYRLPGFHLTEKGVEDVTRLSDALSDEPVAAIFTSPMERTRETANILGTPHGLVPVEDARLLEVRSPLQGKTILEIEHLGGWNWNVYDAPWFGMEGGESLDEIFARVYGIMEEKQRQYSGKTVILVTHGDPVMLIAGHYLGIPRTAEALATLQPYVPMAGGYRLQFQDGKRASVITSIRPIA